MLARGVFFSCRTLAPQLSYARRASPPLRRMLINLLPDFFALLDSSDPAAAYHRYFAAHKRLLEAYWLNYVIEPVGPHFEDIVRTTIAADRDDLRAMLQRTDV